jgi:hypothetical protein
MYKVLRSFADLQDNGYIYNVGDIFPHVGKNVSEARYHELSTNSNKIGVPLIKKVDVEAEADEEEEIAVEPEVDVPKFEEKRGRRKNARTGTEGTEELLHN